MDKKVLLETILGEIQSPIFFAGLDSQRSQLRLHISDGPDLASLEAAARRVSDKIGPIEVSIRAHSLRKLAHPRSVEHWLRQFASDEIIYDPTMVMSRARGLLAAAEACRSAFGDAIGGSFFDPDLRTLFILNREKTGHAAATLIPRVRATVEQAWGQAMAQNGHAVRDRSWASIQVVAELPHRELIPIDAKSASVARGLRRTIRGWLAPLALAFALAGVAVPASANVGAQQSGHQADSQATAAVREDASQKFGILRALSVFGDDNVIPNRLDLFAFVGLHQYFGDKGIRVAAMYRCPDGTIVTDKDRCEVGEVGGNKENEEVGQVGGSG
jgi:hypothetical protein